MAEPSVATAGSLIVPFAPHLGAEVFEQITGLRVLEQAWPEANPALSIGVVLGVTFLLNITFGIPLYLQYARWLGS